MNFSQYLDSIYSQAAFNELARSCPILPRGDPEFYAWQGMTKSPILTNPITIQQIRCSMQSGTWIYNARESDENVYDTRYFTLRNGTSTEDFVGFVLSQLRPWIPNFTLTFGIIDMDDGPVIDGYYYPWNFLDSQQLLVVEQNSSWTPFEYLFTYNDQELDSYVEWDEFFPDTLLYQLVAALDLVRQRLDFSFNSDLVSRMFVMEMPDFWYARYADVQVPCAHRLVLDNYQDASFTYNGRRYSQGQERLAVLPLLDLYRYIVNSDTTFGNMLRNGEALTGILDAMLKACGGDPNQILTPLEKIDFLYQRAGIANSDRTWNAVMSAVGATTDRLIARSGGNVLSGLGCSPYGNIECSSEIPQATPESLLDYFEAGGIISLEDLSNSLHQLLDGTLQEEPKQINLDDFSGIQDNLLSWAVLSRVRRLRPRLDNLLVQQLDSPAKTNIQSLLLTATRAYVHLRNNMRDLQSRVAQNPVPVEYTGILDIVIPTAGEDS